MKSIDTSLEKSTNSNVKEKTRIGRLLNLKLLLLCQTVIGKSVENTLPKTLPYTQGLKTPNYVKQNNPFLLNRIIVGKVWTLLVCIDQSKLNKRIQCTIYKTSGTSIIYSPILHPWHLNQIYAILDLLACYKMSLKKCKLCLGKRRARGDIVGCILH